VYNPKYSSSIDVDTLTIGTNDTNYTLPVEKAKQPLQFLMAEEDGNTTWQYALPTNETNDIEVNKLLVARMVVGISNEVNSKTVTPPVDSYLLPSTLPQTAGQYITAGDIPALTSWSTFEGSVLSTAGIVDGSFVTVFDPVNENGNLITKSSLLLTGSTFSSVTDIVIKTQDNTDSMGISTIRGSNNKSYGGDVIIIGGDSNKQTGGSVEITGGSTLSGTNSAGAVTLTGGISTAGEGGNVLFNGGSSTIENGGDIIINAGISNDKLGGGINLQGGESSAGEGGAVFLLGGTSTTSAGGDIVIIAGESSGVGGDVVCSGGQGQTNSGNSGTFIARGADSDNTNKSGSAEVRGGDVSETGHGGNLKLRAGNNTDVVTGNNGGDVIINGGFSIIENGGEVIITGGDTNIGAAGSVSLQGGSSTAGEGGEVFVTGGSSEAEGAGGDITITAGESLFGSGGTISYTGGIGQTSCGNVILRGADGDSGGSIQLRGGDSSETGLGGNISLRAGNNTDVVTGNAGGDVIINGGFSTNQNGGEVILKGGDSGIAKAGDVIITGGTTSSDARGTVSLICQTDSIIALKANLVNIGNEDLNTDITVDILSGSNTAGQCILNLANNKYANTINLANSAPNAPRTITIAGGDTAVDDTVTIFGGNNDNIQEFNVFNGEATGGTQTINLMTGAGITAAVNIGTGVAEHTITMGNQTDSTTIDLITGIHPLKITTRQPATSSVLTLTNQVNTVDWFLTNENPETRINANPGNLAIDITAITGGVYMKQSGNDNNIGWYNLMMAKTTVQIITVSGNYILPVGCRYVIIEMQAGGGAGGGNIAFTGTGLLVSVGGAGGGGQYIKIIMTAAEINSTTKVITIGTKGVPVNGGNGNAGGDTSFGDVANTKSGSGGIAGTPSNYTFAAGGLGGSSGIVTVGNIIENTPGGNGEMSTATKFGFSALFSGNGGNSVLGQGGGREDMIFPTSSEFTPKSGRGFGSGGSGRGSSTTGAKFGSHGRPGVMIFTEFY
jgi:hypothetical protein